MTRWSESGSSDQEAGPAGAILRRKLLVGKVRLPPEAPEASGDLLMGQPLHG